MSWDQRDNDYNRRGDNYRKVNEGNNGGLTINRTFSNDNRGGGRYNSDNRGGNYNNDNRGNYNNDNRGNYSGRGRGGRGNFNNNNNNRYPHGRRGDADAPKKLPGNMMPRKEEAVPSSVQLAQNIMTRLGDFSAMTEQDDLYSNIQALAQTFISVGDLKEFPAEISELLVKCLSQLSVQVPILCSLLALIQAQEPAFAAQVVERLQQRYLLAVAEDDVPTAKLLLRSVACLTSCGGFEVEGSGGLVEVLEALLVQLNKDLSAQSDTSSALVLSASAQASAYLLASTLIWAAPVLQPARQGAVLQACLAALQRVKAQYRSPFSVGGLQAVFSTFSAVAPEDSMDDDVGAASAADRVLSVGPSEDGSAWDALWESCSQACSVIVAVQLSAEQGQAYVFPAYMNAHWVALFAEQALSPAESKLHFANFATEWGAALSGLGSKAAHCTPAGALTTSIGSAAASTWCRLRLSIFDNETSADCARACALSAQVKYHAFAYLEDVFTFFDPVINEDGTKLGSMELLTTHLLSVFKLFSADAHLEYVLVEMLLQVLLQRPVNSALSASVFRLMLELCRRAPQTFPPVVALGTNTVFQLVPDLDSGSALEFGRWFAFHLLNTQLSWPAHYWEFWVGELQEATEAGQTAVPLFIRYVIEKLSYAAVPDRIRAALPPALHSFIPVIAKPHCAVFVADTAGMLSHIPNITVVAAQLKNQVEKKADPEDLSDWLESLNPAAAGDNNNAAAVEHTSTSGAPLCWRGCLLLQVLIESGAANPQALSALVGLLDRYSEAVLTHASSEEQHVDLLHQLAECYGDNSFMYHFLLDEMMRRGQIGVTAAAKVLCGADNSVTAAREWGANPCLYSCMESLLDRTQDFVKAAVAQRSQLGGDLCLDVNMDLAPSAAPEGESAVKKPSATAMEESNAADGDVGDGESEGHRKRRRADSADGDNNNAGGEQTDNQDSSRMEETYEADKVVDTLWAAEEALKSAVGNSRAVYATVSTALARSVVQGHALSLQQQGEEEVAADLSSMIAASLLRRTLRVFHGTERHLAHLHSLNEVVLSASPAQVQAQLQKLSHEGGIDTSRWLAQLGSR